MTYSSSHSRPALGLLIDRLDGDYQRALLAGVLDAARSAGVDLLCFAGGVINASQHHGSQRNLVYDLPSSASVDGIMLLSGTIGNELGSEKLAEYAHQRWDVPLCSISLALSGTSSVLVDNQRGFREALLHLVRVHDKRNIAFIRGPAQNAEAESRYDIYREVLEAHGLQFQSEFVVAGDFQADAGKKAVQILIDQKKLRPDAIVAANDNMALSALDALIARNIGVPQDIAVVGFDDIEGARYGFPALTTVRQPLFEQGRRAVDLLLEQLGGKAKRTVTLFTELVVRRSCGCFPRQERWSEPPPADKELAFLERLRRRHDAIVMELRQSAKAASRQLSSGWEEGWLASFTEQLYHPGSKPFYLQLETTLCDAKIRNLGLAPWQDVLSALRRGIIACTANDFGLRTRAEDMFHEARILVSNIIESEHAHRRLQSDSASTQVVELGGALVNSFDLDALCEAIYRELGALEFSSCFLALHEGSGEPPEFSRLILAYDQSGPLLGRGDSLVFPTRQVVPPSLWRRQGPKAMAVLPLFFERRQLGFVVLELSTSHSGLYEAIRTQLSAAVQGALLVEAVVQADQQRERLFHDLGQRNAELEAASSALQRNQVRLLSAEKMASLGRLSANIAHEMNTPLAAIRAALVDLTSLVTEYKKSVADGEVTASDHEEIAEDMRRSLAIIASASANASDFVRSIRSQTRESGPRECFDAVDVVKTALMLIRRATRDAHVEVVFEPDESKIELEGVPGRLAQVLTNLVENAIYASRELRHPVLVALRRSASSVVLVVRDEGTGIAEAHLPQLFEPSFSTKPHGQGTGLGLSIVHDVVVAEFGGNIAVKSEVGQGTTFTVTLPLRPYKA